MKLYQQIMDLAASQPSPLAAMLRKELPSPLAAPSCAAKPAIETIALGKAKDAWLASIKGSTLPKTWTIKRTAVELLTRFLGEKTKLHALTRSDLARWFQHMRDEGASPPTLTNKQSYVGGKGGFFEWAMAPGHYPKGDNPASDDVSYSTREKAGPTQVRLQKLRLPSNPSRFRPCSIAPPLSSLKSTAWQRFAPRR